MFDLQILRNTSGTAVLGPWMARGGDNGVFTLNVVASKLASGPPPGDLTVTLETKAAEDAGDGTPVSGLSLAASNVSSGIDRGTQTGGMKELVRYKIGFNEDAASGDWVLFRMLPPSWFDTVKD